MQRENRLAVFEQVTPKKQSNSTKFKRSRSPEPQYEESTSRIVKRARRGIYVAEEELVFNCLCEECNYCTNKYYDLLKHLARHVEEKKDDPDLDYRCTWDSCDYIAENWNYLQVHLTYHGYHSRLKAIGSSVLTKIKLPECKETNDVKFPIPTLPEFFMCEWDNCNTILWDYQVFVDHVKCHVNGLPKKSGDKEDAIRCGWTGCSNTYPVQYKLLDHIRCHTKEKSVACPTCGVMFSCRTKFYDHRKRQLSIELQGYQCSQCSKLFASERLLRDHMRIHINHYKCHLCDMTCTKPSTLAKHIRYRHLAERLFRCDICSHATITAQDLARHRDTHSADLRLECTLCGYRCRSQYTFERHRRTHLGSTAPRYACHCCDRRFAMGANLTKHLISKHDFHWPNGHSRFSYKQDSKTGLYHLQVVRYESLEVTQEMIKGNVPVPYQFSSAPDCKFECVQNEPLSFMLKLANINYDKDVVHITRVTNDVDVKREKVNTGGDEVVISVEHVDMKGNIVKVEAVETGKILFASDLNKEQYKLIK